MTPRMRRILLWGAGLVVLVFVGFLFVSTEESEESNAPKANGGYSRGGVSVSSPSESAPGLESRRPRGVGRNRAESPRGYSEPWSPPGEPEPIAEAEAVLADYEASSQARTARRRIGEAADLFQQTIIDQRAVHGDPVARVRRAHEIIQRNRSISNNTATIQRTLQRVLSPNPSDNKLPEVDWAATRASQENMVGGTEQTF